MSMTDVRGPLKDLLRVASAHRAAGRPGAALEAMAAVWDELEERAEATAALDPEVLALRRDAWLLKGHIHREMGQSTEAAAASLVAQRLAGADRDSLAFLIGYLLEARGGDPVSGTTDLEDLLRSADIAAPEGRARALLALEGLCEGLDLAWTLRFLGRMALTRSDWRRAATCLGRAYELEPEAQVCDQLAVALVRTSRHEEALRFLDLAIAGRPSPRSLAMRGHVLRRLGDPAGAVRDFLLVARIRAGPRGGARSRRGGDQLRTGCGSRRGPRSGSDRA